MQQQHGNKKIRFLRRGDKSEAAGLSRVLTSLCTYTTQGGATLHCIARPDDREDDRRRF